MSSRSTIPKLDYTSENSYAGSLGQTAIGTLEPSCSVGRQDALEVIGYALLLLLNRFPNHLILDIYGSRPSTTSMVSAENKQTYDFLTNDFRSSWQALSGTSSATGKNNFTFALQDMILLEFLSRLCASEGSPSTSLKALSNELYQINPFYFVAIPAPLSKWRGPVLPFRTSKRGDELLWVLYDLVRNGQAHQYLQKIVDLNDGSQFVVQITGAQDEIPIDSKASRVQHLSTWKDSAIFYLKLCPNVLFLDIEEAVTKSGILSRSLTVQGDFRPKASFSLVQLEANLTSLPKSPTFGSACVLSSTTTSFSSS